jgi:Periplasmic binding protein
MITELTTSSVALAVQEISKEKKKIDIVVGAATSAITGSGSSPYGFHWAFDTRAFAVGTGGAPVKTGGDTWFFLTADYDFGYALEKDTGEIVAHASGKVDGSVRVPAELVGLLLLPAAGAELECENRRPHQCRPNRPSGLRAICLGRKPTSQNMR